MFHLLFLADNEWRSLLLATKYFPNTILIQFKYFDKMPERVDETNMKTSA